MEAVLTKAGAFIAIIALGAVLRMIGFFKEGDFALLGKISLRITLPAAIITNFSGTTIRPSLLIVAALGLGMGLLCMAVGYVVNLKKDRAYRAFEVLNLTGCNVGALTSPFLQGFLGPQAVVVGSLFDVGNAAMGLGTSYAVASAIRDGKGFSLKRILKALRTAVALMTYVVMVILTLLEIRLPGPFLSLVKPVGDANTFVAMLMIGVGFRIKADKRQLGRLTKMVLLRYSIATVLALLFWFCLPYERLVRLTLVILAYSPIITAAPAFTGELRGDVGLSSAFNSICMAVSICIYVAVFSFGNV